MARFPIDVETHSTEDGEHFYEIGLPAFPEFILRLLSSWLVYQACDHSRLADPTPSPYTPGTDGACPASLASIHTHSGGT